MEDECGEEGVIPSSSFEFSSDGAFLSVCFDEIEGDASQHGEVEGGVVGSGAGVVFVENDIHDPMQLVLDAPMGAYSR